MATPTLAAQAISGIADFLGQKKLDPPSEIQKTPTIQTQTTTKPGFLKPNDTTQEFAGVTTSYGEDVRHARFAAVSNPKVKNPLTFQDPTDRSAAILARASRIIENPKYQKLSPESQSKVLSKYYDKYVGPGYAMGGFKAPDKDLWLRTVPVLTNRHDLTKEYLFPSTNTKQMMDTLAGASVEGGKIANTISYGGVKLSQAAAHSLLGLSHFFGLGEESAQTLSDATDKMAQVANKRIDDVSHDALDRDNFWLQAHPSKHWTDKLDSFVGENLLQLPFYEAIGAGRIFTLGAASEIAPEVGKVSNLTTWLTRSKKGEFVAKRLGEGADAYIGSMLQGEDQKSAFGNMAAFMGFGTLTEVPGAIARASRMLIKKFTSASAVMGGRPLTEAITNTAAQELQDFTIGHIHGQPIRLVPESEESGYIQMGDQKMPYKTKGEQQDLVNKVLAFHNQQDPVRSSLMNAEKLTLSQMARDNYGKTWQQLTKEQRSTLLFERNAMTSEAISEAPIHHPDIAKAHIENQIQQDVKENPELGKAIQDFEKLSGLKVSTALQDTEKAQIEAQSGIQNSQATVKKIGKVKEPIKTTPEMAKAKEEEPRKYYQFKIDTLAYLKNTAKKFKGEASKGLTSEVADMNDPHEFTHELQGQLGGTGIQFEDDRHALLWANQFSDQLPKPFRARLVQELHELDPRGTISEWNEQSKNLATHMEDLAHTGRLFSQGNVFRSTEVENWTSKTKWQRQLTKEVEQVELERLNKLLKRYPEIQAVAKKLTLNLQKARRKAEDAGQYQQFSDSIRAQKTAAQWKKLFGVK